MRLSTNRASWCSCRVASPTATQRFRAFATACTLLRRRRRACRAPPLRARPRCVVHSVSVFVRADDLLCLRSLRRPLLVSQRSWRRRARLQRACAAISAPLRPMAKAVTASTTRPRAICARSCATATKPSGARLQARACVGRATHAARVPQSTAPAAARCRGQAYIQQRTRGGAPRHHCRAACAAGSPRRRDGRPLALCAGACGVRRAGGCSALGRAAAGRRRACAATCGSRAPCCAQAAR